jgi:uncharacterized membrane protein
MVPPGGRGKAVVIVGLFMGLIGFSLGPLMAGAANDFFAAMQFARLTSLDFLEACPGGQAAAGLSAAIGAACQTSLVNATQAVMMVSMALTIWPAWHFFLAGRNMKPRADAT